MYNYIPIPSVLVVSLHLPLTASHFLSPGRPLQIIRIPKAWWVSWLIATLIESNG